ncbi:MAG: type III-A CRISPR-associated RAMP protein Csm5 [Candidatus Cloacimonetes bacterium]|nr:type III-A CRISPR-associated RAMP protein Csm5 [Candidatus Cloacimonadota bacterium]
MVNKNYKLTIKPITPFHIGNGEVHDPMKFIIKGGSAHFLKEMEYLRYLTQRNPKEFEEKLALANLKVLQNYYYTCFDPEQTQCYAFKYRVLDEIQNHVEKQLNNPRAEGQILTFIRSGLYLAPFIPGSSLKGAIRTAILSHHTSRLPDYEPKKADDADKRLQANTLKYIDWNRDKEDITLDPFKAIKIGDAPWKNEWMAIYEAKVVNPPAANSSPNPMAIAHPKATTAKAQTLPILMETGCSSKGMQTETELSICITDSRLPGLGKLFPDELGDAKAIITMINDYSKTQLRKEADFFRRMGGNAFSNYQYLLNNHFAALKENQCLLRIGMGSGQRFLSYAITDHHPKTRKMIGDLPLGWLKISFEEKL